LSIGTNDGMWTDCGHGLVGLEDSCRIRKIRVVRGNPTKKSDQERLIGEIEMQRNGRRTNRDGITKTGYFWRALYRNVGNENGGKILEQIDRFIITALDEDSNLIIVLAFMLAWFGWNIVATAFAMLSGMGTTIICTGQISIRYCVQNSQQNDEIPDEIGIATH